ncbi:restriction endonuclease [Pantoea agglomerans]|uniref:restriction endonuclease n=1 Tax=Enterobacter agglomerans TaxID=549 RepID=UPI003C7D1DC9
MSENSSPSNKPPLYRGLSLPLHELSSDSFEDFVYQTLIKLGPLKGFEMQSSRQPSGDQGFDCTAKIKGKNELVCIQCKRYSKALNITLIAEEIVKVAIECSLNNSIVKQHYIITSGSVSSIARQILRQNNYKDLKNECEKILNKKYRNFLAEKNDKKRKVSFAVINDYIDSLDKLLVWSGVDFQNELLVVWHDLGNILEEHFLVERVLRDKPTPDFDVASYLNDKIKNKKTVSSLYYSSTYLPKNLISDKNLNKYDLDVFSVDEIIHLLKNNQNIVLSSAGGSGKSYTLSIVEALFANKVHDIEYLPVRINLRHYSRNTLSGTINQELGIDYGSWKSLPFKYIFLFDGLDEMLQHDTQSFYDELTSIIGNNNYLITVRNTGLGIETTSASIDYCFSIQPLSHRCVFRIASEYLSGEELYNFYSDYRSKINMAEYNFLSSPFVLSMSIDYYTEHGFLPKNTEHVVESWVYKKIKKDQSRINNISLKINMLPISKVEHAFSLLLYKATLENQNSSITEDSFINLIMDCYDELSESKEYLPRVLTLDEFIVMAHHYEILFKGDGDYYITQHAIISDYLSSKILSKKWRDHIGLEFNNAFSDTWLYCSDFIVDKDRQEYLSAVFNFDVVLAAKIAMKFKGGFADSILDKILHLEKSERVLIRSSAISALGILDTKKSKQRLKSTDGIIDYHHSYQRRRALALNGDKNLLEDILKENEGAAQLPIKISGGDYGLWFTAPPSIITDIARGRIDEWLENQRPLLCMSLRTLALFGDDFDIERLIIVLKKTTCRQEFFDAAKALHAIDQNILTEELVSIVHAKNYSLHWAKEILFSLGFTCDVNDELDYFISQNKKDESELVDSQRMYTLEKIVKFIKNTSLDRTQTKKLVNAYLSLEFRSDFYYRNLMWSLARNGSSGCFMPIVKLAFLKRDPFEIHNAINYLSDIDLMEIDGEFSKIIDEYFETLDDSMIGTFFHYVQYYLKYKSKEFAFELMRKKINNELMDLSPESITRDKYVFSIFNYSFIFEFLSRYLDDGFFIDCETSLKFILISTKNSSDQYNSVKVNILAKIDKGILSNYCNDITDKDVKTYAMDFLLFNELCTDSELNLKKYLPIFLSHHFFHNTIYKVCLRYWNDELANYFLTCFIEFNWDPIGAQMFEKYTKSFCDLFSRSQLNVFEENRKSSVNVHIMRTYQIWLESKGLYFS